MNRFTSTLLVSAICSSHSITYGLDALIHSVSDIESDDGGKALKLFNIQLQATQSHQTVDWHSPSITHAAATRAFLESLAISKSIKNNRFLLAVIEALSLHVDSFIAVDPHAADLLVAAAAAGRKYASTSDDRKYWAEWVSATEASAAMEREEPLSFLQTVMGKIATAPLEVSDLLHDMPCYRQAPLLPQSVDGTRARLLWQIEHALEFPEERRIWEDHKRGGEAEAALSKVLKESEASALLVVASYVYSEEVEPLDVIIGVTSILLNPHYIPDMFRSVDRTISGDVVSQMSLLMDAVQCRSFVESLITTDIAQAGFEYAQDLQRLEIHIREHKNGSSDDSKAMASLMKQRAAYKRVAEFYIRKGAYALPA